MNHQTGYDMLNDFLINNDSTTISHDENLDEIDKLKLRLNYFFLDPIEKWKRKNTKPWKLLVQIIKLIVFTHQLVLFGSEMSQFITYKDEMQNTFKLLLLEDWEPSVDAVPYPGPYVPFTVYKKSNFYSSINHAISTYANIEQISVGPFGYHSANANSSCPLIEICLTNYAKAEFQPDEFKYNYSMSIETKCHILKNLSNAGDPEWEKFDVKNHLTFNFSTMISTQVKLPLRTLLIEDTSTGDRGIVCFDIDIDVIYNNEHRDGQIAIELISRPKQATCQGYLTETKEFLILRRTNDILVLIFALLSSALCIRSLWRAYRFMIHTDKILRSRLNRHLSWKDKREFFDNWLILIILNDLMILAATVIIYSYDERLLETNNYTTCSLLLGLGNFLSWAGLLRYLSFFEKYNLLLLTLKKSLPHVMRFMLCTTLIYW